MTQVVNARADDRTSRKLPTCTLRQSTEHLQFIRGQTAGPIIGGDVRDRRTLVRIRLAEETGHHLLEGGRLIRVERMGEPLSEGLLRHGLRHLIRR